MKRYLVLVSLVAVQMIYGSEVLLQETYDAMAEDFLRSVDVSDRDVVIELKAYLAAQQSNLERLGQVTFDYNAALAKSMEGFTVRISSMEDMRKFVTSVPAQFTKRAHTLVTYRYGQRLGIYCDGVSFKKYDNLQKVSRQEFKDRTVMETMEAGKIADKILFIDTLFQEKAYLAASILNKLPRD